MALGAAPSSEEALIDFLAETSSDPYAFVMGAFPWGEPGTELEDQTGPNEWQTGVLCDIRDGLLDLSEAIRIAVTSGHGVGKSALVSWLLWWAISTMPDTIGRVTANTERQLRTRTWVEVSKWYRLLICAHMFKLTASAIFSRDPARAKTWRVDLTPWSEQNTEAFAGLHNKGRRIILVFDEASAIPATVWEVAEGALTDEGTEIIWAVFGNPTQSLGRFRDCFDGGRFAHRWKARAVDSRTVPFTNKKLIQQWIDDYGEDHDFVRVRVRGMFPRVDASSFISRELALEATDRPIPAETTNSPLVLGVDVARFGNNYSVIYPRRGFDARTHTPRVFLGLSTTELAAEVQKTFNALGASMIFVDEGGIGGGVVDILQDMMLPVMGVNFGGKPQGTDPWDRAAVRYCNRRSEIWGTMRNWLRKGAIPDTIPAYERRLSEELSAPLYGHNGKEEIQLESKKDMERRQVESPDVADALAISLAYPTLATPGGAFANLGPVALPITPDYDPFAEERLTL